VEIDPEVATVNDLVDGVLRMELGYGKDISIAIPGQVIYEPCLDPDDNLEDNLEKKLSNWGIGQNSFLKVSDENIDDEKDTRVDIEIIIIEK
jgi:ubiquitin-like 1-activating enzyme E1 B